MTSACAGFSSCRIEFVPNNKKHAEHNYSDRSLVEIRQYDFGNYSLRALDIENNKTEIFNIPLEDEDQYKRGKSGNQPDEIDDTNGTYRLWLKDASRKGFYATLDSSFQEINFVRESSSPSSHKSPGATRKQNQRPNQDSPRSNSSSKYQKKPTSKDDDDDDDDDDDNPTTSNIQKRPVQPKPNPQPSKAPSKTPVSDDDDDDDQTTSSIRKRPVQPKPSPQPSKAPSKTPVSDDDDDGENRRTSSIKNRPVQPKPSPQRSIARPKPTVSDDDDDDNGTTSNIQKRPVQPKPSPATSQRAKKSTVSDDDDDDNGTTSNIQKRPVQPKPSPQTSKALQKTPISDDDDDDHHPTKPIARGGQNQQKSDLRNSYGQQKSIEQSNENDLVAEVYQLGQHIRNGRTSDAAELAKKLSSERVQLQGKLRDKSNEEKPIEIKVKIDSNNPKISKQYKEITMDVYPSTTIRELRTAFEIKQKLPPSDQYFFVNGHLAHENSTMNDLNVHRDLLFVLFLLQQ